MKSRCRKSRDTQSWWQQTEWRSLGSEFYPHYGLALPYLEGAPPWAAMWEVPCPQPHLLPVRQCWGVTSKHHFLKGRRESSGMRDKMKGALPSCTRNQRGPALVPQAERGAPDPMGTSGG